MFIFNRVVTGFSPTVDGNRFVYFDNDAWWFSVNPDNLTKQVQTDVFRPDIASVLATKYGFSAPNDALISKYETYAKNVAEVELMDFDGWLAEYVVESEANDLNQIIDTDGH